MPVQTGNLLETLILFLLLCLGLLGLPGGEMADVLNAQPQPVPPGYEAQLPPAAQPTVPGELAARMPAGADAAYPQEAEGRFGGLGYSAASATPDASAATAMAGRAAAMPADKGAAGGAGLGIADAGVAGPGAGGAVADAALAAGGLPSGGSQALGAEVGALPQNPGGDAPARRFRGTSVTTEPTPESPAQKLPATGRRLPVGAALGVVGLVAVLAGGALAARRLVGRAG